MWQHDVDQEFYIPCEEQVESDEEGDFFAVSKELIQLDKEAQQKRNQQKVVEKLSKKRYIRDLPKVQEMLETIRQTRKDMQQTLPKMNIIENQEQKDDFDEKLMKKLEVKFKQFNLTHQQFKKLLILEKKIKKETKNTRNPMQIEQKKYGDGQKLKRKNLVSVQKRLVKKPHVINPRLVSLKLKEKQKIQN